jgi:hypothetical protein
MSRPQRGIARSRPESAQTSTQRAPGLGPGPFALGVAVWILLGAIMPVGVMMHGENGGRGTTWYTMLGVMVLAAARLAQLTAKGETRLLEFVTWVYIYVFFGLAATIQLRTGAVSTTTPGMPSEYDGRTARAVLFGIVAFMLGVAVARRTGSGQGHAGADAEINVRRAKALLALGFLPALYYVASIGVGTLFTDRTTMRAVRSAVWPDLSTSAIVFALSAYPILVAVHALAYARRHQPPAQRRRSTILAIIGAAFVMFIVNPLSSARYVFGSIWGSLLNAAGAFRTAARTRLTMLGVVLAFLFVFPIADAFRRPEVTTFRAGFFEEYEYNGDYDSFWQITNAIIFVDEQGITWGRQLLGSLLFWVPRAIWRDKPMDTGVMLAEYRGYSFNNLSAPLWAEAMVNFGWIGLILLFLLVGLAVGRLDLAAAGALQRGTWSAVPVAITSFYVFILLRGSLLQATGALAVMLVCSFAVRGRRRVESTDPPGPARS